MREPNQERCVFGCAAGIGALTNLRELRVSGNKLSSLSAKVGALRKLHRLIADNNLLTSIPGRHSPRLIYLMYGYIYVYIYIYIHPRP